MLYIRHEYTTLFVPWKQLPLAARQNTHKLTNFITGIRVLMCQPVLAACRPYFKALNPLPPFMLWSSRPFVLQIQTSRIAVQSVGHLECSRKYIKATHVEYFTRNSFLLIHWLKLRDFASSSRLSCSFCTPVYTICYPLNHGSLFHFVLCAVG